MLPIFEVSVAYCVAPLEQDINSEEKRLSLCKAVNCFRMFIAFDEFHLQQNAVCRGRCACFSFGGAIESSSMCKPRILTMRQLVCVLIRVAEHLFQ
jgi:hypothetical protein